MVRQKTRKTVENLHTINCTPTTQLDENLFQNSKNKNEKTNVKADICIHNNVNGRKKIKSRNHVDKKDQKTLINEETVLGKSKRLYDVSTNYHLDKESTKDEDTEEFFIIIQKTVEKAVENSLQDIIGRSLRDISIKLDEISKKVNISNENSLNKIEADIINKIIHYGEENSRHFRYLCMKSEYDKMFYQHQNVIAAFPIDARTNMVNSNPHSFSTTSDSASQPIQQTNSTQKPILLPTNFSFKSNQSSSVPVTCKCRNNGLTDFEYPNQSKLSVSSKSSDMGLREVKDLLEQLQKYYDQHNNEKNDPKDELGNETIIVPDQDDSADGDEDDENSDDMTSPSIDENIGAGGDS